MKNLGLVGKIAWHIVDDILDIFVICWAGIVILLKLFLLLSLYLSS